MGGIRTDIEPWSYYHARNYALFTNGLWATNAYVGADTDSIRMAYPLPPGTTTNASIAVVEVGDHEQFDENNFVPGGWIKEEESDDAARIRVQWTAGYLVDENNGENSLGSVILYGINRFGNCEPDQKFPLTRAKVWYTIEAIGGDRYVRLWANGSLIASGFRTGNGLITFSENNGSGLTGSAILTYTADVVPKQAFLLLRWAAKYYLHYSKSVLTYPRTPEMVVYDRGVSNYIALTPVLSGGSWNYAVQAVGDDNTLQSPVTVPTDSPKLVKNPPLPVTHGTPTGNASGITLHWTAGEPGCAFTIYYSLVDEPVNLGQWHYPLPIYRPLGSDSCLLPAIPNYAPMNRTSAWNAFVTNIDNVVIAVDAAYDAGYTGFNDILTTQEAAAQAALISLSTATGIVTTYHAEDIALLFNNLATTSTTFATLTTAQWKTAVYQAMSMWLNGFSMIVDGNAQRYTFTDGSLPWSGSGINDGDAGSNEAGGLTIGISVKDLVTPLITNRILRVIIRATRLLDGLQEVCDEVLEIELDSTGAIVLPRPNPCSIYDMSFDNLTGTFKLQSKTDDQKVAASTLAIYRGNAPTSPTYASPAGSTTDISEVTGLVTGEVTVLFPTPGYYVIGAKSISAAGVLSAETNEMTVWVGTEQPAGPLNILADVIRAQPEQAIEDD